MQSQWAPRSQVLPQSPGGSQSSLPARSGSISGRQWLINSLAIIVLLAIGIV